MPKHRSDIADTSSPWALDCYWVLGVQPSATHAEIEMAYRKSLESLPVGGFTRWCQSFWYGRNEESIRHAYETLGNPVTREKFDAWRKSALSLVFLPF